MGGGASPAIIRVRRCTEHPSPLTGELEWPGMVEGDLLQAEGTACTKIRGQERVVSLELQ